MDKMRVTLGRVLDGDHGKFRSINGLSLAAKQQLEDSGAKKTKGGMYLTCGIACNPKQVKRYLGAKQHDSGVVRPFVNDNGYLEFVLVSSSESAII